MRCEHERNDAAYVLGALTPAEREAHERHLAECSTCRRAVADLAGMPGLLTRLDAIAVEQMLVDDGEEDTAPGEPVRMPDSLLPRILEAAGGERRRRRWRIALAAGVAASLALMFGFVGRLSVAPSGQQAAPTPTGTARPAPMSPIDGQNIVGAEIVLTDLPYGTRVEMRCWYNETPSEAPHEPDQRWEFSLVAVTKSPHTYVTLATWWVGLGEQVPIVAITKYHRSELAAIVMKAEGKFRKPVLRYDVP